MEPVPAARGRGFYSCAFLSEFKKEVVLLLDRLFGHVNLLAKGMDVAWQRQEVISQNIANADTPNYKSQHIEFETAFRQALEDQGSIPNKTTRPGHFQFSPSDPLAVNPVVVSETHHSMRMDGNNVDVDQEMVELSQNTILYNEEVNKANAEFSRLRLAITGSR